MWFKVSVHALKGVPLGAAEDVGVEASSEVEAEQRAREAGYALTTATTYQISEYGLHFVHRRLPSDRWMSAENPDSGAESPECGYRMTGTVIDVNEPDPRGE